MDQRKSRQREVSASQHYVPISGCGAALRHVRGTLAHKTELRRKRCEGEIVRRAVQHDGAGIP